MPKVIEIICSSLFDAQECFLGGAGRIELVSALSEGGLTPSYGLVQTVLELPIDVAVMLRPSSRSFCYRDDELQVMRRDLLVMEKLGVRRVVLGALTKEGRVDVEFLKKLLWDLPLQATFHRAIDESQDPLAALKEIASIPNFTHVLSSGGPGKAQNHVETLKKMMEGSLRIIVGSGVNLVNAMELQKEFRDYDYDLHLGTAMRHGEIQGTVDHALVKKLVSNLQDV